MSTENLLWAAFGLLAVVMLFLIIKAPDKKNGDNCK